VDSEKVERYTNIYTRARAHPQVSGLAAWERELQMLQLSATPIAIL